MSRACPVICTSVGGNTELVGKDYLFRKDDEKGLTSLMIKMMNNDILLKSAEENFNRAQNYSRDVLNKKRDSFYEEFINDKSLLPK